MWEKRSKFFFVSSVCTALMVGLQMALYCIRVMTGWSLPLSFFDLCNNWLKKLGFDCTVPALYAFVVYTILWSAWVCGRRIYKTQRTFSRLTMLCDPALTTRWSKVCGLEGSLLVVQYAKPIALTMGFFRPSIVLSTGLLSLLDPQETEAVIRHEQFHQKHRDPMKKFVLLLFSQVMWYLPILAWWSQQYTMAREILADREAIMKMGSPASLGSALLKLLKQGRTVQMDFAYMSFAADSTINCRIRHILDPQSDVWYPMPLRPTMISLPVITGLSVLFLNALI